MKDFEKEKEYSFEVQMDWLKTNFPIKYFKIRAKKEKDENTYIDFS